MTDSKKIKDNPSFSNISNEIKALENLLLILEPVIPNGKSRIEEVARVKEYSYITELPDSFNERFSKYGWIAYESMGPEAMQEAIAIHDTKSREHAEQFLVNLYNEGYIEQGIRKFKFHPEFNRRIRLANLAKEDYLSGRYHACIPLLLSLLDGTVNDISKSVGFFADSVNLTVWDSIAAHETGLQALAKLFAKSRTKTNSEIIEIPYRHGILHGRELAFDNKIVAAKVWAAFFATNDWAIALKAIQDGSTKKDKQMSWTDILAKLAKNNRQRKLLSDWRARPFQSIPNLPFKGSSTDLPIKTPERTVAEFIENWKDQNYGFLAQSLFYNGKDTLNKRAGVAKTDFRTNIPVDFKILSIDDKAPSITVVETELIFIINQQPVARTVNIRTVYVDKNNKTLIRSENNGVWKIIQHNFDENPLVSVLHTPLLM